MNYFYRQPLRLSLSIIVFVLANATCAHVRHFPVHQNVVLHYTCVTFAVDGISEDRDDDDLLWSKSQGLLNRVTDDFIHLFKEEMSFRDQLKCCVCNFEDVGVILSV